MPEDPYVDLREAAAGQLQEAEERFAQGERGSNVQLMLLKRTIIKDTAELEHKARTIGLKKAEIERLKNNKESVKTINREARLSTWDFDDAKFVKG
jgi:hypothetical protein